MATNNSGLTRFLIFTLYAPIGSFGETAIGERRMSWARPGRSAILGLVGAAQGIDRNDEAAHMQLEKELHYAVRTDSPGRTFVDYHTAQVPTTQRGRTFGTRREELECDDLNTVLSTREWRSDTFFTIALWPKTNEQIDLEAIARCLRQPYYVLYMGRKAGPLGLPLNPEVIEARTSLDALDARQPNEEEKRVLEQCDREWKTHGSIACDHDAPGAPNEGRIEHRRDTIVNRKRWQFSERLERIVPPKNARCNP